MILEVRLSSFEDWKRTGPRQSFLTGKTTTCHLKPWTTPCSDNHSFHDSTSFLQNTVSMHLAHTMFRGVFTINHKATSKRRETDASALFPISYTERCRLVIPGNWFPWKEFDDSLPHFTGEHNVLARENGFSICRLNCMYQWTLHDFFVQWCCWKLFTWPAIGPTGRKYFWRQLCWRHYWRELWRLFLFHFCDRLYIWKSHSVNKL